jgi:hypothetical protein
MQDMRCFDALCDLYGMLGEDDMVYGLWQVMSQGISNAFVNI